MIRLLMLLFTGDWHAHQWMIIDEEKTFDKRDVWTGTRYITQCKHCGKLKSHYL